MRNGFSRWICLLLCAVILVGYLPMYALAARSTTVTIKDQNNDPVENATISVTIKRNNTTAAVRTTVSQERNGQYLLSYNSNLTSRYTITLTITADGYQTTSVNFQGNKSSVTVSMIKDIQEPEPTEPEETEPVETDPPTEPEYVPEWEEFKMYYYIKGSETDPFPDTYAGSVGEGDFGPSGDNTPFAILSVDVKKLREEYSSVAVYQVGKNTNQWQYVPGTTDPNLEDAKAFWDAVLACMSEESRQAFEATGLSRWFIGYVLKKMSASGGGEQHCDGILKVTPPVYSIELYLDEVTNVEAANYVGGLITNDGEEFKTMTDVLNSLESYLGHTITWDEDANGLPVATNGVYNGRYVENNIEHTITVRQSDRESSLQEIKGSEIRYVQKSEYYYVACFVLNIVKETVMNYTVVYNDGIAGGKAFYDHSYGVKKTSSNDPKVPAFPYEAKWENHLFLGWELEGGDGTLFSNEEVQNISVNQDMVFRARWKALFPVVFHTNNTNSQNEDIFRIYRSDVSEQQSGEYLLNQGKIDVFYDIPTFAYDVHNGYIFKGWYMGTETDAAPMDWNAVYGEETHIYAHWIRVGSVNKEDDGKIYESDAYPEYDLLGNQIRVATENPNQHYGDAAPGLRFIASLSERVYQEMNALHANNQNGIEYGFVIAATSAAQSKANGNDYMLKYKHATLNGEDTTSTYSYVNNIPCRVPDVPVDDHYDGEQYRLYTAVITYKGLEGDRLTAAQNTNFIGRAYLRYFDANGLERVHYNNYTGNAQTYGGVNTCYSVVQQMISGM